MTKDEPSGWGKFDIIVMFVQVVRMPRHPATEGIRKEPKMPRGTWILAVTGALAMQVGVVSAADPAASSEGVPTRYSRRPASAPKSDAQGKNYFDDLFAEPDLSKLATGATRPSSTASNRIPVGKKPVETPVRQAAADEKDNAPVTNADFEKDPFRSEGNYIQHVRAEARGAENSVNVRTPGGTVETGPQTPQVTVEWVKKSDINVGQECTVQLVVKNSGAIPASQVEVDALFPPTIRLTAVEPKPASATHRLTWSFPLLAPGAEKVIEIKMIPGRRGDLGTTAQVRFTGTAAAVFRVEEPMLKVALKGPAEVMIGDPVSQLVMVSNPGTGVAQDVKILAQLDEGLEYPRSEKLEMAVGSLAPGETRTVRLPLTAVKGGKFSVKVSASSAGDLAAEAESVVNVIAPSLTVAVDGPGLRYKGRSAKYSLTVKNDGTVPNNNVRVTQSVASGFRFISADRGGKYDAAQKNIQWFVGRLEPGQTAEVSCELMAADLGAFTQSVNVTSDAGVQVAARMETEIDGASALTMEIVELDDPVEVGTETAYEIRVKNDGSKAAANVALACELPPAVELITAKGATEGAVEGRLLVFKALGELNAGTQAIYRIHVKASAEGNHKLRARLTSNSIQEPLIREEQTKFYSDANR